MVVKSPLRGELPPLPYYGVVGRQWALGYTAEQMMEYARASIANAIQKDFLSWWVSIETDERKALLANAHSNTDSLHALLHMAFEAGANTNA